MIRKMNHLYTFMLNAEHHCRLDKYPYPGEEDDGNYHEYDDIWAGTKSKSGNDYMTKMNILDSGFQRYITNFYYPSETTDDVQGCDGKNGPGKKPGKQYRYKRLTRKIAKPIKKIIRRKRQEEKRKNQKGKKD